MSNRRAKIFSIAALGCLTVLASGPSELALPGFSVGKAYAENNGNGNGHGNSGNSGNAGNSGNKGNSANAGNSAKTFNAGNSGNSSGNSGNAGNSGTVLSALGNFLNRGQAKKAEVSATSQGLAAAANTKMKPKDLYSLYGIHPSDVPGGWMGAFMGDMKQKAGANSVHGRAQAALVAYNAVNSSATAYQNALAALAADVDLAALDPASPTYNQDVATLANTKIGQLADAIALLDPVSPTYDADLLALQTETGLWQSVLDTQSAMQTAQGTFEQAFEDVTKGQTPYSEPLAGTVMMIYQDKTDALTAANGG